MAAYQVWGFGGSTFEFKIISDIYSGDLDHRCGRMGLSKFWIRIL